MKKMLGGVSVLALVLAAPAWADHWHVGVVVGPVWGPPVPYYYPWVAVPPPTTVVVPAAPPVYVEQQAAPADANGNAGVWYYCSKPKGYYPYVKKCPGGWQQVPQTPPDAMPGPNGQ